MPSSSPSLEFASKPLEAPIRAELFGVERLEQHAESLAAAQPVLGKSGRGRSLLPRVQDNGRVLREGYREIAKAIREERAITPAAEWLVDNFHIVDEQLREIRDDLPPGFYRELPKLAEGPLLGYPRVYGIAWAFVAHTDSRFDPDALRRFVLAYQRVQPLTVGELWAVAITLRVVLVENLRRLTESIVRGRAARQTADALADELLGLSGRPLETAAWALQEFEDAPLVTAFAVQLVQRLRDQDPAVTPALRWLNERLAGQGTTPDDIVRVEHQRQAVMNVTVRNVIMSMGLMSALDWTEFFESVSLVDGVLQADAGYAAMDFATRDSYRHAIEELARGSRRSELEVAREVIARAAASDLHDGRQDDPGFYLVGDGRRAFELTLGFRAPLARRLLRAYVAGARPGYLGTIAVLTLAVLTPPLLAAWASGAGAATLLVLGLVAAFPASDLAIALLNRVVTALLTPGALPRLELRNGVPPALRTMIVVPTLLTRPAEVEEQIERLEVHYLANSDGDVRFALLSDWTDAPAESVPGDEEILATAREGIARLNRRHGMPTDEGDRFLLFHRRRLWNEGERSWMGWERKRGKLHELNRLLRGATDTSFLPTGGLAPTAPPGIRYVITLDADTRLPRGAVKRLVGTMAHPLNRPRLDPKTGRVVEGYAVLQPRVTPPLPGREGSFFQRLSSGPSGIDPYAAAVSDVYQDLFGEGSYTGKGIYEVDAFEAALAGRVPENALLSHDLFEGLFARAGLVTDVELFESAPSHYGVAAARQHRWARGDWQLLPWILGGRVPVIGRWKMVDNLRRALSAPAAFLTLLLGWTLPATSPLAWTAFVFGTIALPTLLPVLTGLIPRGHGFSKRSHARAVGRDLLLAASQTALTITMLAYQAWLMVDAMVRSLLRVYVTHRHLLEWVTAAQAKAGLRLDLRGFYQRMGSGVALAIAGATAIAWGRPAAWPVALPFLLLWAASPVVARSISVPSPAARTRPLSPADARALRLIARRTWRFFSTFVGAGDHALPPDNFQEDPHPVVAHRTSPTNLGLYLLSTVAARDFGWIGTLDAVDRLEATFEVMSRLERFRGHFLNWYDTADCRPLNPRYVSSVDSGNLAGHLIALKHACLEMIDHPPLARTALDGIEDAVLLIRESARALEAGRRPRTAARHRLDEALDAVMASLERVPDTPVEWARRLTEVAAQSRVVTVLARGFVEEDGAEAPAEVVLWAEVLGATVESHIRDLDVTIPISESLIGRLVALVGSAQAMVAAMDFAFLFDPVRQLFAIGYRVEDASLDPGRYDLLASEARLTSFVAIAKGDVPVSHWFRLGRALTPVEQDSALVSWSGSMFEYLMPGLVMRAPAGSLLEQSGGSSSAGRSRMAPSAASPGASRSRGTTRATSSRPTSIRTSACRVSGSGAGSARMWSSPRTRPAWRP
jgi:cyclic beta-1,2-glucan synthetase